ncbi:MAG: sigma 54-interacting transcriptional regulator [Candidatus Wallbacteria bacterium]|nr:sigma 54-interacting transcriptional regulator [Candidatus Wallbacteria bacterium]
MGESPSSRQGSVDGTERIEGLGSAAIRVRCCRLVVVEGPDTGLSQTFDGGSVTVGSGSESDLRLQDRAVSRTHVILELTRDGYRLRDLDSSNGTFVDGVRVKEAFLHPGGVLQMGRTRLRFEPADQEISTVPSSVENFHGILGSSPSMRKLFGVLERLAPTGVSVLITGESGTGKELVAKALHDASPRATAPFVVFDCANTDREFIRSELFGHEAGAFTGAAGARAGAFECGNGGTVFLDELGELPLELQPRLLRVLQERRVTRLGGSQERRVDVRVVSATNRDLLAMAASGAFREDLYYRLAQIVLPVPALRERPQDIGLLARSFLSKAPGNKRFTTGAVAKLASMPWPGNVRELRNCVDVTAALTAGAEIGPEELHEAAIAAPPSRPPARGGMSSTLDEVERETIERALGECLGNISKTARVLGISRPTLRAKLRRFGLRDC